MEFNQTQSSSYFVPNYPITEPVFYIPLLPEISAAHEPIAPKKPPPQGYDLKTLRKQVEYLQEEINERVKNHNAICQQNAQLWEYVQELLEANKYNAATMKERVVKLNEELRTAQKERYQLLEKLELARNSKKMLNDLAKELEEAQVSVEEIQRRKADAEKELRQAKVDRESLEEILNENVEKLHGYEDVLEQYRNREAEDAAADRADDFYFTNRSILKAAYHRFRDGVMKRARCNRIHRALQDVYHKQAKVSSWTNWKAFLFRKKFMHRSQRRRGFEIICLCFKRWKVFSALERYCVQSARRKLLVSCLEQWKAHSSEQRFESWAATTTADWKLKCFKRKFFRAWRGQVMFLGWCDAQVLDKEQSAKIYFRKYLLRAWRAVARRESAKAYGLSVVVAHNFKRFRFVAWHTACRRSWSRRGRLLRKFFCNLSDSLQRRNDAIVANKQASKLWITNKKRSFLRRWRTHARRAASRLPSLQSGEKHNQRYHAVMKQKALSIREHYHKRMLRSHFLSFLYMINVKYRQRICGRVAMQTYLSSMALGALCRWRSITRKQVQCRLLKQRLMLCRAMEVWRRRVKTSRHEAWLAAGIANLQAKMHRRTVINTMSAWYSSFVHRRRVQQIGQFLGKQMQRERLGRCFRTWRGKWGSTLYWQHKELLVDQARVQALQRLSQLALENYAKEGRKLTEQNQALEETLMNIQELLADKKNEVEQQAHMIAKNDKRKAELQEEIGVMQQKLAETCEERDRWQALEMALEEERRVAEQERERRRRESADRVSRMREESSTLQKQLAESQETKLRTMQAARAQGEMELKGLEEQVDRYDAAIYSREEDIRVLESEQDGLSAELSKIQRKVAQVAKEGDTLREENEHLLRRRLSELTVAEADAGVAQARVMTLYDLLDEQRGQASAVTRAGISAAESREKAAFLQQMSDLQQRYASSPLVTTVPLWQSHSLGGDMVNMSSRSEEQEQEQESYVHEQQASPMRPAEAPDSAYKRHRYHQQNPPTASTSGAHWSPTVSPPAPPQQGTRRQHLFITSPSPLSSPTASSQSSVSSVPLASVSSAGDRQAAASSDKDYQDARDTIRSLTQRLQTRFSASL